MHLVAKVISKPVRKKLVPLQNAALFPRNFIKHTDEHEPLACVRYSTRCPSTIRTSVIRTFTHSSRDNDERLTGYLEARLAKEHLSFLHTDVDSKQA